MTTNEHVELCERGIFSARLGLWGCGVGWGTPCLLSGLLFSFGVWLVVFVGLWGVNILRVGHFGVIGFFIFSLFVINELL